ncbi:glycerate kinase [Streptomyces sp. NPDC005962]|uniref:glycerate kinase n=1 Tax=Streptomyces sp. NPDC005962 TaxID=3154466 RepID=UPI0033D6667D
MAAACSGRFSPGDGRGDRPDRARASRRASRCTPRCGRLYRHPRLYRRPSPYGRRRSRSCLRGSACCRTAVRPSGTAHRHQSRRHGRPRPRRRGHHRRRRGAAAVPRRRAGPRGRHADRPGGRGLADLRIADLAAARAALAGVGLVLATDVESPLLGATGVAAAYGPSRARPRATYANWTAHCPRGCPPTAGSGSGPGDG